MIDLHFHSLTIIRPAPLGGARREFRPVERLGAIVLGALRPVLPPRMQISQADKVAALLIEAALTGAPGAHIVHAAA